MFKRENRLVPGIKFNKSFLFTVPQFVLKEKKNGLIVNRFGIVVSKKIDKRAVIRNRIKRFFRISLGNLDKKMNKGHDILIVVRKETLGKTKEENFLAIEDALEKAGIIKR
jgi:ribonuclease P protein component